MFTSLLSQITARVKSTISAYTRKAVIVAIAVVVFLFALAFGLVAAYHALVMVGFTPLAAAGVVGAGLLGLALLVLGVLPFIGRKSEKDALAVVTAPGETLSAIDQGLTKSVRKVGALPLVLSAFVVGFLVSRR